MCYMDACKEHCEFGFWKAKLIFDKADAKNPAEAMGDFGRNKSLSELVPKKVPPGGREERDEAQ